MATDNSTSKSPRKLRLAGECPIPRFVANLNAMAVHCGLTVQTDRVCELGSADRLQSVWAGTRQQLMSVGIWSKSQHLPQACGSLAVPMGDFGRDNCLISGIVDVDADHITYTIDHGYVPDCVELIGPVEVTRYLNQIKYHGTAEQLIDFGIDRARLPTAKRNARCSERWGVAQVFASRRQPDGTILYWCESPSAMRDRLAQECERRESRLQQGARPSDDLTHPASTVGEWKAKHHRVLENSFTFGEKLKSSNSLFESIFGARFHFSEADLQHINSILHRFHEDMHGAIDRANVIDFEAPRKVSFLRLVVDNEVLRPEFKN